MNEKTEVQQNSTVVQGGDVWKAMKMPGVSFRLLHVFPEGGSTVLIKMEPGSTFPLHHHPDEEEVYVIEGDVRVGKYELKQGDYMYTPPGAIHASKTREGCTLLATSRKPLDILKNG